MKRKIVQIHEEKCNGCGICVNACHEGAIKLIDGKAKLISDEYCDGLGDCLPGCPMGAIEIIERDAVDYSEEAVQKLKEEKIKKEDMTLNLGASELRQWPVQLKLINTNAGYLKGADLLVAADCTAYAYADFHKDFIKDHRTVIGCPKLDDVEYYKDKLVEILKTSNLNSLTVVRMEVTCCGGIVNAVKTAMLEAQTIIPYKEVIISTEGNIIYI